MHDRRNRPRARATALAAVVAAVMQAWTAPCKAEGSPAPVAPAASSAPAPTSSPGPRSGNGLRTVGWVSVAVGAEAAVVAVATSFMLLHQKSVRDRECDAARTCTAKGIAANDTIRTLTGWNAGAWAVAAVGLGAGVALVLTHPASRGPGAALGVSPSADGASLVLRGWF